MFLLKHKKTIDAFKIHSYFCYSFLYSSICSLDSSVRLSCLCLHLTEIGLPYAKKCALSVSSVSTDKLEGCMHVIRITTPFDY